MKNLMMPVGISDFEEIRGKGYYYIDKSGLISDILKNEATKVTLITRPRRFGKTMAMSMLASFFDIEKDSKVMFGGLKIEKDNKTTCEKWMNNSSLEFAVITGCLKIAKESIFTGTNNFVSDTIATTGLNEYFGFTQNDIDRMLEDADAEGYAAEVKEWYDGYHFGETDVYCPWDVMNYMRDLQTDPDKKTASYWKNMQKRRSVMLCLRLSGAEKAINSQKK